jgi:hypothetical protein
LDVIDEYAIIYEDGNASQKIGGTKPCAVRIDRETLLELVASTNSANEASIFERSMIFRPNLHHHEPDASQLCAKQAMVHPASLQQSRITAFHAVSVS